MQNQQPDSNKQQESQEASAGCTEVAKMGVQSHLLITDADTDEVLVNQRG